MSRRLTVRRLTVPWKIHARSFVFFEGFVETFISGDTFNSAECYTAFTTVKNSNHITTRNVTLRLTGCPHFRTVELDPHSLRSGPFD